MSQYDEIRGGIKKRQLYAILFLVLPLPLLINFALHGGSKFGMPELNVNGDQTAITIMYGSLALNFLAFFAQVIYTGRVLSGTIPESSPLSIPQLLLFYLPGNFIITLILELSTSYSVFVKEELYLLRLVLGVVVFLMALELWFRYFRRHGQRFQNKTLLRKQVLGKYKTMFLLFGLLCSLCAVFPEKGFFLVAAGLIDSIACIFIWEALGAELNALNQRV